MDSVRTYVFERSYKRQKATDIKSRNASRVIFGSIIICGALLDLVPFVQFKKREKHPWRSVTSSKVAGFVTLLKVTLLHGVFHVF